MDFALSEEQELLQETVRGWVEAECPPGLVREVIDGAHERVAPLWSGLVEMGIAGLLAPERHGGAGLELLDLAVVAEELGRGCVPGPFLGHSLAVLAISRCGSDAQQERWLPRLASGEALGTVAIAEALGGWLPSAWQASLEGGKLTGEKAFVPHAEAADLFVVGVAGGGLAVVERGAAGLAFESEDAIDRTRVVDTLRLDGAPAEALENADGDTLLDAALVLLAADAFGAGHALVRMSAGYAMQREQFGQPIAQFQGVKHQLANMALEVDPTRGLWWYAAHAFDRAPDDRSRMAAIAKAHVTDRVMQVARDAVEVHGGIGFTWECDVQMWFKRAMFDRAFCGTPEVLRERSAALGGW